MNTIGKVLKQARTRKKISITRLAEKTKIKEHYLRAIEKEEWHILPNLAVTQGFVRSVAGVLGASQETATALLRRDFEERKQTSTTSSATIWTPRTTIFAVSAVAIVLVGLYLTKQYQTFVSPPPLEITKIERSGRTVTLEGKTSSQAQVLINNEPLLVGEDGSFGIIVTHVKQGDVWTIESRSRSGKSTKKEITVP